jgi:hypothetical protein
MEVYAASGRHEALNIGLPSDPKAGVERAPSGSCGYNGGVLRQGPIPRFAHGVAEYVGGGVLVAAPFILNFHSGTAKAVAIVIGVLVIVFAASTDGPTGLVDSIPLAAHVSLDYLLAGVLIAAPFIFSFSSEAAPTAFFIVIGVLHVLITIGTRFSKRESAESG